MRTRSKSIELTLLGHVEPVTGVESPYEEYIDEWNDVPKNSIEREAQVSDVTDQVIDEKPAYTMEFARNDFDMGLEEYSPAPETQVERVNETPSAEKLMEVHNNNDRPTRVRKPVE